MPIYSIQFCGRRVGAIGIMQQFTEQATGDSPDAALLSLYDRFEHVFAPKITPLIPWLVQIALPGETHASPDWETVTAPTSQAAVVAWLETHDHHLPIRLRVGPAAALLRYPNGMPMITREFTVTADKTAETERAS